MDKASAYGAGDCRLESCRGHNCPQTPCHAVQLAIIGTQVVWLLRLHVRARWQRHVSGAELTLPCTSGRHVFCPPEQAEIWSHRRQALFRRWREQSQRDGMEVHCVIGSLLLPLAAGPVA